MSWSRAFVVIGALMAQVSTAMAADMPKTLPPDRSFPVVERQRPSFFDGTYGWYLRGDLGYQWGSVGGTESVPGFSSTATNSLGNGITGGVGVGIKSDWLRTDLTINYSSPMKYRGMIVSSDDVTAKISALDILMNGYLDLGTWYHLSPYIGAGAGAAQTRVFDYESAVAPPFTGGLSKPKWNFAWAFMAGVAYALSTNTIVDVGYRYLNIGDLKSETDSFGDMTFKNVAAHEVRVGLRWSFDDLRIR